MRLIDADAIPKEFLEYEFDGKWNGCTIKDLIDEQPTIQPEKTQLSSEGTTSDTISRQATIDAVNNAFDRETLLTGFVRSIALRAIRDMPSVQPEPQEGHWIDKGWDGDWGWQIDGHGNCWRVIECSECGKGVLVESSYCPHCGARMKGAEHETD